jgi:hypothetical protein
MPLTLDQLPDDVAELKGLLLAKDAELIEKSAELAATCAELIAAKNGLVVTQLTIENLKAQLAKLRRSKFGARSERIERVLERLELALEEAETAKAEAIAAQPQQPEPEVANAEAQPAEDAKPEKKKRRQLPPEFPRRDVMHAPPGVCKTCGGFELRTVSETITPARPPSRGGMCDRISHRQNASAPHRFPQRAQLQFPTQSFQAPQDHRDKQQLILRLRTRGNIRRGGVV